jgi:hypothetical protein
MNNAEEELVEATVFCNYYQIEGSFISSLQESDLVELVIIEEQTFIPHSELQKLEKIVHLHQELDVNLSGVEVIVHMLERIEQMQQEMNDLKRRLSFYED